jgi:hypothetical protein
LNDDRPKAPDRVPTLTEVVAGAATSGVADLPQRAVADAPQRVADRASAGATLSPIEEEQIVGQVLVELQRRIDQMLEYRLREALAPALARAADALVVEARNDLARTLRDVLARAVAQAVAQRRPR